MGFIVRQKEDITIFFLTLGNEQINFHPDKRFAEYVSGESGILRYTEQEVALREEIMNACFDFCAKNGLDIYDLYAEIYKTDVEPGLRHNLPELFELLGEQSLDWKSINKKLDREFQRRKKNLLQGKTQVE